MQNICFCSESMGKSVQPCRGSHLPLLSEGERRDPEKGRSHASRNTENIRVRPSLMEKSVGFS